MPNRAKQLGNSGRGPKELDRAKQNQGLPADAVTIENPEKRGLASGSTEEQDQRREAQRPGRARRPRPPA
jgi:hypothetical protein